MLSTETDNSIQTELQTQGETMGIVRYEQQCPWAGGVTTDV